MRPLLPLLLVVSVSPACNCSKSGADNPTPVTLQFTNTTQAPLFIDATDSTYGMVVAPNGATADTPPFLEALPSDCSCYACELICNPGGCPGQPCLPPTTTNPQVQMLPPDASVQRQWSGVYYNDSNQSCGALVGGQACLQRTNDFPDDTFTARICYGLSVAGGAAADAGVPFPGAVPAEEQVCAFASFQPQQGTVLLVPPPPQPCTVDAGASACPSGQLCFSGLCSSGCPLNNFPQYGNGYYVSVSAPSGAFFVQTQTTAATTWTGTGMLTGVTYLVGGTTILALSRSPGLSGTVDFTLPQVGSCCLEAYHADPVNGETLQVTVIEAPPASGNRAVVVRDGAGQLLQVADMAMNAPVLDATQTAPFTVTPLNDPQGCSSAGPSCKAFFSRTEFTTPEGAAPALDPGAVAPVTTSGANFQVLNVTNINYQATSTTGAPCSDLTELTPYVIINSRP